MRSFPDGAAGFELAAGVQSLWLLGEGNSPSPSLLGDTSYLAQNAAYIIYPISLLTRILPIATTILLIQSLALSLAIIPLFNIARNLGKLHFGTCSALVVAYGTYISVHSVNLSGFSPAILALPAIFYILYLGLSIQGGNLKNLGWKFHTQYWLLIIWVLACRADLGLALAGFGVLLIVEKKRNLGLITAGVCFGWLLLAVFLVQPALGDGHIAIEAYQKYGSNPLGVFWGMLKDPAGVITDLRTEENIRGIIRLFAPLVFLPLVRPRYILPVVPLYLFYLLADIPEDILGEAEQTIAVIAFLFVALVFALRRIGTILVEKVRVNFFLVWVLVVAATMFFIQDSVSSIYNEPWHWNNRQAVLEEAIQSVPGGVKVGASTNLLSNLAEREDLFEIKAGSLSSGNIARQVRDAEWILIDSTITFSDEVEVEMFISTMGENGWRQRKFDGGLYSFSR